MDGLVVKVCEKFGMEMFGCAFFVKLFNIVGIAIAFLNVKTWQKGIT